MATIDNLQRTAENVLNGAIKIADDAKRLEAKKLARDILFGKVPAEEGKTRLAELLS